MNGLSRWFLLLCVLCLPASAQHIALTADGEGRIYPCADCPLYTSYGGLERRATVVRAVRQSDGNVLLLDAGATLFGPESASTKGKVIAQALVAMGYDAVNLSGRDFRYGKEATVALIEQTNLPAVSCNVLDAASGHPVAKPYIVVKKGDQRVAVVGVTDAPPAALVNLPQWKQQLAGIRFAPAEESAAAVVEKAKAESDRVVVLYYGRPTGLASLQKKLGGAVAVYGAGGMRPNELSPEQQASVIATAKSGKFIADAQAGGKIEQRAVPPETASDPEMAKLLASAVPATQAVASAEPMSAAELAAANSAPAPAGEQATGAATKARNRGVEIEVKSAVLADGFGAASAPQGQQFLIIDTTWTNIQPAQMVKDKPTPVTYKVPKLSDHLYVVADGRRVLPWGQVEAAGLLTTGELMLEKEGDSLSGKIICAISKAEPPKQVSVRFYDFAQGNVVLTAMGGAEPAAEKPIAGPAGNEVVEVAVYGVKPVENAGGVKVPEGMCVLAVDLRARSVMVQEVDAEKYKPVAAKGEKMQMGAVADWKDSRKYLQLVVDGQYAYWAAEGGDLAAEPRVLPDVMTGGTALFMVPKEPQSVALRCDFPNAAVAGKTIRPKGVTLALQGNAPAVAAPQNAVAEAADDPFKVVIAKVESPAEFAGQKPADGKRFVAMNVYVENAGKDGEFFQAKEQLKFVSESGEQSVYDLATMAGLHPPADVMWIPAGEKRVFDVVYSTGAKETRPRLGFSGATPQAAKVIALPALEAAMAGGNSKSEVRNSKQEESTKSEARNTPPPQPSPAVAGEGVKPKPAPAARPVAKKKEGELDPSIRALDVVRPPGKTPKGIAGVGLTAEQVNAAIDSGAAGLWAAAKKELRGRLETFGNSREDELVALALVHAEFHKKNAEFNAAVRGLMSRMEPDRVGTYRAGLMALLLEAYGDPSFITQFEQTMRYLVNAQGEKGTWNYNADIPREVFAKPEQKEALQISGGKPLDGPGAVDEPWKRVAEWKSGWDGDNSVTQFALLGLNAASRSGMKSAPEIWQRNLKETLSRQNDDGGWAYHGQGQSYGSMTSAGVCAVAIARHELGEKEPADDLAVARGVNWLAKHFAVDKNPQTTEWEFYYIYSLERVGRICDTEFIGEHEWYPLGARYLVDKQKADGTWVGEGQESDPRLGTSFALLFLTRATPTLDRPIKRGGNGTLVTNVATPAVMRVYVIMDCSGSMLEEIGGKPKIELAQDAMAALVDLLPAGSEFGFRAYGYRLRAIEQGADEDTKLLLPLAKLDKEKAMTYVRGVRARGKTPMALSLEQAAGDLRGSSDDRDPVTLILLTDGGEDSRPRRDPVKAAALFAPMKNVRFHIVGFDINRPEWSEQLAAMAAAGGARYWPAAEGQALVRQMRSAVFNVPDDFMVKDGKGQAVWQGKFGESKSLPEGKYAIRAEFSGNVFEKEFWINTEATTAVSFDGSKAPRGTAAAVAPPAQPAQAQPAQPAQPEAGKKFCTSCGKPLKAGAKFCTECGAKVE